LEFGVRSLEFGVRSNKHGEEFRILNEKRNRIYGLGITEEH